MSWVAIIRLLLSIINRIAEVVRDRQLLDAGAAGATAKALADTVETLGLAKAVKARLAGSSEAEIDAILAEEYRD